MFTLFVGRNRTPHIVFDKRRRTQAQFEAIERLLSQIEYACGNPFDHNKGPEWYSTFRFLFYDKNQKIQLAKITPTGRVSLLDVAKEKYYRIF